MSNISPINAVDHPAAYILSKVFDNTYHCDLDDIVDSMSRVDARIAKLDEIKATVDMFIGHLMTNPLIRINKRPPARANDCIKDEGQYGMHINDQEVWFESMRKMSPSEFVLKLKRTTITICDESGEPRTNIPQDLPMAA